jgi:lysozyme family protein
MTAFTMALQHTLAIEKGYSNVAGDNGGETYKGISRVFHPSWDGWEVVDEWKRMEIDTDVRDAHLTPLVEQFYRSEFWEPLQGDAVAAISVMVACELFDTAVNMGRHRAVTFLQTALNMQNAYGRTYPDLPVDGILGKSTLNTLRRYMQTEPIKYNERVLLNCMNGEQYIAYKQNAQHERFRGWFSRV